MRRWSTWFTAAILACTLYGVYDGMQTHHLILSTVTGFIFGLTVGVVGAVVLWLARQFRERVPRVAWLVGNVLFWLGAVASVWCLGLTGVGIYQGLPARMIALVAEGAAMYFILGWGARRLIAPARKSWISPAKSP
jgi:hypothetical protein